MFARALELAADSLILDLEDAVTPRNKERARDAVCEWLREHDFGGKECLVRINPQDSPWGRADLDAVVSCRPDGLVLPKLVTRGNVDAIDQIVGSLESEQGMTAGAISLLLIGAELPAAVFNLPALALNPRVDAVTWGAEDLGAILGAHAKRDADGNYLEVFSYVRATCLLAAAAAGAQAVDAVYVDFSDTKGLEKEAHTAAAMGFHGKLTIHPDQVDIVNAAFTPGEAAVAEAQALIEAFEAQQEDGHMVFSFNGRMVDVPHLKKARELLALAARISGQTG